MTKTTKTFAFNMTFTRPDEQNGRTYTSGYNVEATDVAAAEAKLRAQHDHLTVTAVELFAVLTEDGDVLKTFTHNGYNGGRRQASSFRIGYTEYRVWTLGGFWRDALIEFAEQVQANVARVLAAKPGEATGMPNFALSLPAYHQTEALYVAEQKSRGSEERGASPQGAMITNDRAFNAQRAAAFHALPEVTWGEHVMLDGVEYVVTRHHNDHVRFVTPADLAAKQDLAGRITKANAKAGR